MVEEVLWQWAEQEARQLLTNCQTGKGFGCDSSYGLELEWEVRIWWLSRILVVWDAYETILHWSALTMFLMPEKWVSISLHTGGASFSGPGILSKETPCQNINHQDVNC